MISYELIEIIMSTIDQSYYFILRYFHDVKKIINSIDCNWLIDVKKIIDSIDCN